MNRQNTKTLQKILYIFGGLFFLLISFGSFIFPAIFSELGLSSSSKNLITIFSILIIFITAFSSIVLQLFIGYRKKADRREDMQKFALQKSWNFQISTTLPFLKEFNAYINENSWFADSNVLTGSSNNVLMGVMNGRNIVISDQIYTTGYETKVTHKKTLLGIELNEADLPFMCICSQSFYDDFFSSFFEVDINFPHRPDFSQTYLLYGVNEPQIRNFFDDEIITFFEQQPPLNAACGGKYLVIWSDRLLNPAQIMKQFEMLFKLANLFLKK